MTFKISNSLKLAMLGCSAMTAALAMAAAEDAAVSPGGTNSAIPGGVPVTTTTDVHAVSQQSKENTADVWVDSGNRFFLDGEYADAIDSYLQAAEIYQNLADAGSDFFKERLRRTKEQISKTYYYWAQDTAMKAHELSSVNDFDTAISLCQEAVKQYPAAEKEMSAQISLYEKMRTAAEKRSRLSTGVLIPNFEENKYLMAVKLKQAKTLYYTGQYEKARQKYQEILLIDKLQPEAIQGLRACNLQITKKGNARFVNVHKRYAAEAAWKGVLPIIVRKQNANIAPGTVQFQEGVTDASGAGKLRQKLESIVIPEVSFNSNEPLPTVIKFLRDRSKALDPDGEGINVVLLYDDRANSMDGGMGMGMGLNGGMGMAGGMGMGMNQGMAAPGGMGMGMNQGMAAPGGMGMNQGMANQNGWGQPPQGMNRNQNAWGQPPRSNAAGNQDDFYDEEEGSDEFSSQINYPRVNMSLVAPTLLQFIDLLAQHTGLKFKIDDNAVILASPNIALDDMEVKVFPFDQNMLGALGGSADPNTLMSQLEIFGVGFPIGSKILFDPQFRALIAFNTPENLQKINDVVMDIRKQDAPPLVQIQVKFVEVKQTDLKELGFIQSLARPSGDAAGKTDGRLQFDKNDNVLYDSGNTLFTYSRETDGYSYNLTVNAVDQLASEDVLSSPKVLTMPGREVYIEMVTYIWVQDDFDDPELETGDTADDGSIFYVYTPPIAEFTEDWTGIKFSVTPTVDRERRLISMNLQPEVRALVGWTTYKYEVDGDDGYTLETEMSKPIFSERTTNTNIKVADGETVVLGGIVKDYTTVVEDKVPFLGDIPVVGTFFRSNSNDVEKVNLLIFVTARLLRSDGTPYYPSDSRGRPFVGGVGEAY